MHVHVYMHVCTPTMCAYSGNTLNGFAAAATGCGVEIARRTFQVKQLGIKSECDTHGQSPVRPGSGNNDGSSSHNGTLYKYEGEGETDIERERRREGYSEGERKREKERK